MTFKWNFIIIIFQALYNYTKNFEYFLANIRLIHYLPSIIYNMITINRWLKPTIKFDLFLQFPQISFTLHVQYLKKYIYIIELIPYSYAKKNKWIDENKKIKT